VPVLQGVLLPKKLKFNIDDCFLDVKFKTFSEELKESWNEPPLTPRNHFSEVDRKI